MKDSQGRALVTKLTVADNNQDDLSQHGGQDLMVSINDDSGSAEDAFRSATEPEEPSDKSEAGHEADKDKADIMYDSDVSTDDKSSFYSGNTSGDEAELKEGLEDQAELHREWRKEIHRAAGEMRNATDVPHVLKKIILSSPSRLGRYAQNMTQGTGPPKAAGVRQRDLLPLPFTNLSAEDFSHEHRLDWSTEQGICA